MAASTTWRLSRRSQLIESSRSGSRRRLSWREKSPSAAETASRSCAASLTAAAMRPGSVTYSASGRRRTAVQVAAALLSEVVRTTPHDTSAYARFQENGVRCCDRHNRGVVRRDRIWNEQQRRTGASGARFDAAARWRTPRLRRFRSTTLAEKAISVHGFTAARATQVRADVKRLIHRAEISFGFPRTTVVG